MTVMCFPATPVRVRARPFFPVFLRSFACFVVVETDEGGFIRFSARFYFSR